MSGNASGFEMTYEWWSASAPNGRPRHTLSGRELVEFYGKEVSRSGWLARRERAKDRQDIGGKLEFPQLSLGTGRLDTQTSERFPETLTSDVSDEEMLRYLGSKGFTIVTEPDTTPKVHHVDSSRFKGDVIRFGVVSDTHLTSKYQQLTYLNAAYDLFAEQGITDVLHAGDLVAGNGRVYRGQQYEMFCHGADEVTEYVVEKYPQRDGITTHIVSGNHDLSFLASDGIDLVKRIAEKRPDFNYLGQYSALLNFNSLRILLHHGMGGGAYARSYKLQKLIEQLSPENKPNAYFLGHFHSTAGLEAYRNVFARMLPCFEAQTPFLARLGLYPEIGFYIVKAVLNPADRVDGVTNFRADYYPYYVPLERDW